MINGVQGEALLITEVDLSWLWKETHGRLERLARCVRECKQVTEASDFCRWLQFSGLPKIFKAHPQAEPFRVDHAVIDAQIREILFECGELFRKGKADPQYSESDIAEINRKLDIIAAHVSKFTPPLAATTGPGNALILSGAEPDLTVMQGGAS